MNQENKNCQSCKNEFTIESEDLAFYAKMKVPPPTWCPQCRLMRRFVFRNEHKLFRKKDEATGNMIFSEIPEGAPFKIYNEEFWRSDGWDAMQFGRDYDFSCPFFEK